MRKLWTWTKKGTAVKLSPHIMVPRAGIEPARTISARDFKSLASTNSATQALISPIMMDVKVCTAFYPAVKGMSRSVEIPGRKRLRRR